MKRFLIEIALEREKCLSPLKVNLTLLLPIMNTLTVLLISLVLFDDKHRQIRTAGGIA